MRPYTTLIVTALFAALFTPTPADAAKPAKKIAICHVNGANDVVETDGVKIYFGRRIEVTEDSLDAHFAKGDGPIHFVLTEQYKKTLEQQFGITIRNADCGFFVEPD